ncbi:hypothetical protein [Streptococcus merionis]|uniref:hypothetical protein n=1 Tax=Streptococcus merionis TaxID=400065 RepID=UPI003514A6A5
MKIRIIERFVFNSESDVISTNYGLEIDFSEEQDKKIYPIYPFSNDKAMLLEFVAVYYDDLKDFYLNKQSSWFSFHLLGFDTEAKERFKDRWYKKGVVVN